MSPKLFQLDLETVVKVLINKKYANHVIQNVGLAICLYDLISLDESCIYQGEGDAYTRVRFRLIVFSPFLGEVLEGTIKDQDKDGIDASFDFFDSLEFQHHLCKITLHSMKKCRNGFGVLKWQKKESTISTATVHGFCSSVLCAQNGST